MSLTWSIQIQTQRGKPTGFVRKLSGDEVTVLKRLRRQVPELKYAIDQIFPTETGPRKREREAVLAALAELREALQQYNVGVMYGMRVALPTGVQSGYGWGLSGIEVAGDARAFSLHTGLDRCELVIKTRLETRVRDIRTSDYFDTANLGRIEILRTAKLDGLRRGLAEAQAAIEAATAATVLIQTG